ncbi:MAG: DnaJ domain-containing protein, partial [Halieaceae bacterium]|nr:DnaJ domain-containing protein [Halieaceae bacterium]
HPDVSKETDAELRFKEVGEANEVLKDPEKRAAYDQLGAHWKAGQDFHPPPEWDQGFEFQGGGFTDADAAQFSTFFETLFGHGGFSPGGGATHRAFDPHEFHARGEDSHAKVLIDLEDAFHGATRMLTLKHSELGADGRPRLKERTLNVRIPGGVCQGQHIRLAKQGGVGIGKGEPGDLYLEIGFHPHPIYRTDGRDVFLDLPVAPWEAALGAGIKAPTPTGPVDLKIPADSGGGRKLRLKGRGIPGNPPGDLYLLLQITLPPAKTETAKSAYREFEKALPFNPRMRLGV